MVRKVVVIDDSELIRGVATFGLKDLAGWQVMTAGNGREGLERVADERPDAVLLDLIMPRMDGCSTYRQLKSDPATRDIPIIFLTASQAGAEWDELVSLGATQVIAKPFDPAKLAASVAGLLGWEL
jgi:CheY-like chemotaxis protein